MDTKSLAHTEHPEPEDHREDLEHIGAIVARSTRHLVTDARFAGILEEDFGIPASTVLQALDGEPRKQAIKICTWAEKTDEPSRALTNWAKKYHKGSYRPSGAVRAANRGEQERRTVLAKAFLDRFGRA